MAFCQRIFSSEDGSQHCENLPQLPGRSSPVLSLAHSSVSTETNTILRKFSVCLTFQAEDPASNHFSTLTSTPATSRLGICFVFFHLKAVVFKRRAQCIPGNSAELTLCLVQVGKCLDSGWKVTARSSHPPPEEPCALFTFTSHQPHQPSLTIWELQLPLPPEFPKLYRTDWEPLKDSQTEVFVFKNISAIKTAASHHDPWNHRLS